MKRGVCGAVLGAILTCSLANTQAAVTLPAVLSSHMVLQQKTTVPIWGRAEPNEAVAVKFRSQEKKTTADAQGRWLVQLDALDAGGPDAMTVTAANSITLTNILVGEVWVGSGQSNMQMGSASYTKNDARLTELLAAAPYPKLRVGTAKGWREATAANCSGFSALLFSFGVPLQKELDVPVGLLLGAVGGTPSGYWLSEQAYRADETCQKLVSDHLKAHPWDPAAEDIKYQDALKKHAEALAAWEQRPEEEKKTIRAPAKPAPPVRPGESAKPIGHLYEEHIRPMIPFAMRGVLWDQGESGTGIVPVDQYTLMGALIRGWRNEWDPSPSRGSGAPGKEFPFLYVQKPSGGGCAFDPADPVTSRAEPLAPLPTAVPVDGANRELHIRIMRHPNTVMVTSSDLGSGIHPANKSGYGARAARVALGTVYGKPVEYYGPTFDKQAIEGAKIRVSFSHVGKGLAIPAGHQRLQGFAVAGEDKRFVWADAVIDGSSVVVASGAIAAPRFVRYAWAANAPWANLFNADGLPALSFRTDP